MFVDYWFLILLLLLEYNKVKQFRLGILLKLYYCMCFLN